MESTKGKIEFLLTVVGATGLPPSDENHPTNFYVAVEVDGKHGRTAELAPSPQSTIEWNVSFPLIAVKASYIALRVYECWEAMLPDHPRGDEVIWESRATAQQLMGCGSKFTNLTLPAKAPHEEGYLIVKVERGAHAEAERPVVDENLAKPRCQDEMRELEPSAVQSVHDFACTVISFDFEESCHREKLEQAIDYHRVSLVLRPAGHPEHSTSLVWLADTLLTRFNTFGDGADLDEAMGLNRAALALRPPGHRGHSTSLNNLASTLSTRFNEFGDKTDLDEAIELNRAAVVLCPPGHRGHVVSMNNLALTLSTRFNEFGDRADLSEAMELNRAALVLCPPGHTGHSTSLMHFASTLSTRFNEFGDRADLDKAIELNRAAIVLCPPGYASHSTSLSNLAVTLLTRFKQFGNRVDLNEAMKLNRAALALCPLGHAGHSTSLSNLASTLSTRFNEFGDSADLNEAMELNRTSLVLCPPGHAHHSISLSKLADTLFTRFNKFGNKADLDEAMELHRAALVLRPPGHHGRSTSLNNLADILTTRFNEFGDKVNLNEAMELNRAALALCPSGHAGHSTSLGNLANTLLTRFNQFGDRADLNEAIELNRAALVLCPPGHRGHITSLNNLASTFSTRFNKFGDRADLYKAMELNRAGLALCPPGHAHHFISLSNLAITLLTRFKQFGDRADLNEAIELNRTAFVLCPPGHHGHIASLNNLASTLFTRFNEFGNRADLDEATELNRAGLTLCPPGHAHHPISLISLADTLSTRFKQFGDRAHLDESAELHRAALALCPPGHAGHSTSLNHLASTLSTRFKRFGDRVDLDEAIQLNCAALAFCPQGHPLRSASLSDLAIALAARFNLFGDGADLDVALRYHEMASTDTNCGSWRQVQYSLIWVEAAETFDRVSALNAYRVSLANLDRHTISRSSVVSRHTFLKSISSSLAANAASCALRRNEPATAVELLEQGRGIIWTQMANLHTPLQQLSDANAQGKRLAKDLQRISSELNGSTGGLQDEKGSSRDEEARRHRRLAEEWDSVVCKVRRVEGFSRFLLPPLYSDLQQAAIKGPVILINASEYSCDALIVLRDGPPHHIPLRNITLQDVTQLELEFACVLKTHSHFSFTGHENGGRKELFSLLRSLWHFVAHPIVRALGDIQVPAASRIWLCPTSKFTSLPLHAAGPYRKGELGLSDLYITSYTPTLSALIRTRRNNAIEPLITPKFAAIGQAMPSSGSYEKELLTVNAELDLVLRQLPSSVPFVRLADTAATKRAALDALCRNSWVHLACHGKQDTTQAFNSCFAMHDKPLSLLDIVRADISHPEFAFLSACHTAVGDAKTPDEVIHLAAGMQFAGFKSVIGTMWAVDDEIAHHMVSVFYKTMFEHGMNYTKAAASLNTAMRTVDKKAVPLEQRIVFVHIGA